MAMVPLPYPEVEAKTSPSYAEGWTLRMPPFSPTSVAQACFPVSAS